MAIGGDEAPFVVICENCDMSRRTSDFDEATTFAVKHEKHTGHTVTWERAAIIDTEVSVSTTAKWRVNCDRCDCARLFDSEERARDYHDEHIEYAGHAPEAPERVEYAADDLTATEQVLDYCFEHSTTLGVVPREALLEALEAAGITRRKAAKDLAFLEHDTDLYEPTGEYLARP